MQTTFTIPDPACGDCADKIGRGKYWEYSHPCYWAAFVMVGAEV